MKGHLVVLDLKKVAVANINGKWFSVHNPQDIPLSDCRHHNIDQKRKSTAVAEFEFTPRKCNTQQQGHRQLVTWIRHTNLTCNIKCTV